MIRKQLTIFAQTIGLALSTQGAAVKPRHPEV